MSTVFSIDTDATAPTPKLSGPGVKRDDPLSVLSLDGGGHEVSVSIGAHTHTAGDSAGTRPLTVAGTIDSGVLVSREEAEWILSLTEEEQNLLDRLRLDVQDQMAYSEYHSICLWRSR